MRKFGTLKASLFAASALLLAAPAAAQPDDHHGDMAEEQAHEHDEPSAPVDPNAIQGSIAEPQSIRSEQRVQLEAGRAYVITVNTEAFDAVARLMRAGSTEVLAEDDDSGGGTSPRIRYTPQTSGEYVVQVSSFSPSGHGDYALSVTPQAPLPAVVTRATRTERGNWQVFQGELSASDPADDERRFDDYELRLTAGQTALIQVTGEGDIDTMVQLLPASDRHAQPLAENDDASGGTLNAVMLYKSEEGGTYVVRVTSYGQNVTGRYQLRIAK